MKKNLHLYLAVFAIACSVLIFETTLLRFFAAKLLGAWPFLVISLAFLGIGASGTYLYLKRKEESVIDLSFLSKFASGYAISLPLSIIIFALLPLSPPQPGLTGSVGPEAIFVSLIYMLLFSIPFFLSGVCVSYVLSLKEIPAGRVLFFDLAGAGLGSILAVLLLSRFGGYGIMALAMALAVASQALFSKKISWPRLTVFSLLLFAFLVYPSLMVKINQFDIVSPKSLRGEFKLFKNDFHGLAATYWDPISRIDLSREGESDAEGFLFGLSSKYRNKKYTGRYILVDSSCITRQFRLAAEDKDNEFLGHFLFSLPYQLKNDIDKVLIVGAGGGVDILVAKHFKAKDVDVAEINSATVKLLEGRNKNDSLARVYSAFTLTDSATRVNFYNEEGRSFLSKNRGPRYDILQLTGVDLLTALKSGGLVFSENYLYTKEALGYYYDGLKEGGYAQITYWSGPHALRLFVTALDVLKSRGKENPALSLIAVSDKKDWTNLIIKKGEFSEEETRKIRAIAQDDDFEVLFDSQVVTELWEDIWRVRSGTVKKTTIDFSPDQKGAYFLASLKEGELPEGAAKFKSLPFDLTPTSDDKPFFYSIYKELAGDKKYDPANIYAEASKDKTSRRLIAIGLILVGLLILLPLFLKRKKQLPSSLLPFFGLVGVGFAFLEIALIQKFSIFVGGPFYSLAITLPAILIFYALGAFSTSKIKISKKALLLISVAAILAYGLSAYLLFDNIIKSLFYLNHLGRIIVAVLLIMPAGFFLGFPTPVVFEAIKEKLDKTAVPLMWGVNSSGNVLGALLFAFVSQITGFNLLLLIACSLYFVALLSLTPKLSILKS